MGLLTLIALGETIVAIFFTGDNSALGYQHLSAVLGVLIAFCLEWIYFDVDASRNYLHALRRNIFSGILFTGIHLPLHCSIVASTSSITSFLFYCFPTS